MNIRIKATGFELTPAVSDYVGKRLEAVSKFLADDPSASCSFEVGRTTAHHRHGDVFKAEAHIVAAHRDLYVAEETSDPYAAIDAVRDEVLRRLSSDKGKRISRLRRGGIAVKEMVKGLWRGGRGGGSAEN